MQPPHTSAVRARRPRPNSDRFDFSRYESAMEPSVASRYTGFVCDLSFDAHAAQLDLTDGSFIDYTTRFTVEKIGSVISLSMTERCFYWLATVLGQGALETYKIVLPLALKNGVDPTKARELLYLAAAAIGISRAYPFLVETVRLFEDEGLEYIRDDSWNVNSEYRREAGWNIASILHGPKLGHGRVTGNENYPWLSDWLVEDLYGAYYARDTLTLVERECAMFSMISVLGVDSTTLAINIEGILNLGVDPSVLMEIATSNLPFLGYVRLVDTLQTIEDTARAHRNASISD